jgi:hypothetical protein
MNSVKELNDLSSSDSFAYGHLDCLKYVHENTCTYAAEGGHLDYFL